MLRTLLSSGRYAIGIMRSTPDQDKRLAERLQEAVTQFAGGSVEKFARRIGYANGGYVREILGTKGKPVREALIERVHADPEMVGWFLPAMSDITARDIQAPEQWDGTPAYMAEIAAKLSPPLQEKLVAFAELLAGPRGHLLRYSFSYAEPAGAPTRQPTPGSQTPPAPPRALPSVRSDR